MRRAVLSVLLGTILGLGIVGAQTPLTPAMSLSVKTDASGYLMLAPGAYVGPSGPLTPFSTIRLRTDSAGQLMVTFLTGTGSDGTVPTGIVAGSVLASNGVGVQGVWSASPTLTSLALGNGLVGTPGLSIGGSGLWSHSTNFMDFTSAGVTVAGLSANATGLALKSTLPISWSSGDPAINGSDTFLLRDNFANIIGQRNGTSPQAFTVYNTYTDSSNYERLITLWSGNTAFIATQALGTGVSRPLVIDAASQTFRIGGTGMWLINSSGNIVDQGTHTIAAGGAISSGGEISAGTNFQLTSASGAVYWASKSIIKSPTDGIVSMTNNASTTFTRLILGTNDATTSGASFVFSGGQIYVGKGDGSTRAGYGRVTAQTAANASIATYTVGAADSSFEVQGYVSVTASVTHAFQLQVTFTDEGNVSRTLAIGMMNANAGFTVSVSNTNGTGPYAGSAEQIRCKAGTTITIFTQAAGTYTSVTYNAEGSIRQIS
jgi:hypothetical protein